MNNFAPAPCIPDERIEARIPGSPFSVLTLIEARNRLNADKDAVRTTPEALRDGLNLSLAQVYAALAYYHANQDAFDAELTRREEAGRQALAALFERHESEHKTKNGWAEIGKWPGDESDEEIEVALERLS